jgi:hypothetical protein
MATKTHDPSVNMRVNWTAEGVMFVTQVQEEPSFPYLLIRDEETDLLYPKVGEEECNPEPGAPRPRAPTSDSSEEECGPESPSSIRANTSDSSDEEWDEESLVHETYGRRTYNFGDTKLGPIYNNCSVFFNHDCSEDEFAETDYP